MNTKRCALLAILALLAGCHGPTAERDAGRAGSTPPTAVRVETVREVDRPIREEVVGTVRARTSAAISSSIRGTVREVRVTLGSNVRQGDVLVRLSAAEIDAQASQARAAHAQAQIDMERTNQLFASHAVSQAAVDAANAQFRVAQAALAEAEVMRGYAIIRAPISGVITAKECAVGDLAVPGRTLLVLESPGAMRLEAFVPETIAQHLSVGMKSPVHVDALGRDFEGTVGELSPSADTASRTVLVKLDLPATPELRAGMYGRLVVTLGQDRAIAIPRAALVRRGQMETVFVHARGVARLRIVRAGRVTDGQVELLSGLEGGEEVIVSNPERLLDGQAVVVQP